MSELAFEIEDLLRQGFKATTVAAMLSCPLKLVHDVEDNLMSLTDPRSFGPDYDQE
jgi:hypothetical protein